MHRLNTPRIRHRAHLRGRILAEADLYRLCGFDKDVDKSVKGLALDKESRWADANLSRIAELCAYEHLGGVIDIRIGEH